LSIASPAGVFAGIPARTEHRRRIVIMIAEFTVVVVLRGRIAAARPDGNILFV